MQLRVQMTIGSARPLEEALVGGDPATALEGFEAARDVRHVPVAEGLEDFVGEHEAGACEVALLLVERALRHPSEFAPG
jgi:hypothetical protein